MSVLIKRNQVDGLVAMKALLDQIDTSYPASKVTTTVAKVVEVGQDPANYTGQELLSELKANVDGILSGAEDLNLPELARRIAQLNAELNGGTYEQEEVGGTQRTLLGFKNKVINDVVRIEFSWNGTTATASNPDKITDNLTAGQNLSAYTVSGTPLVSSTGTAITFNFDTKTFSSAPYILDVDATKASGNVNGTTGQIDAASAVYTAYTGSFKVFPVGTWTLETLPADALLDNNEMQLIAYDQALQKIIIQLATDKNLINRITEAVGETAIQDAVKDVTEGIDARLDKLEGTDITNLSKVAVKVSQITGKPAGANAEQDPAETVTKTTAIASKAYVDAVDDAIKADIGAANASTNYDVNGKVQSGTVRSEINGIKNKMLYKDALVQEVKAASVVNNETVTDNENTISETALVNKFIAVDSAHATLKNNFETFRDTTAPATYVTINKVTNTFTRIAAVNGSYTDSYADPSHPEVIGKKIFNEQISQVMDTIDSLDSIAYKYAAIVLAPAVVADATTGITAKNAEAGPVAEDTPVLSAQYTRNLVQNEQERATKAEADVAADAYDWHAITIDPKQATTGTINEVLFNATTGAVTTNANKSVQITTSVSAEGEKTKTTNVPSIAYLDREILGTKNQAALQDEANRTELINRIAYEHQLMGEAVSREIERLFATNSDAISTPADGGATVYATADGRVKQLDDKTVDWVNIQVSSGIVSQIKDNNTVLQDTVAAEAAHSANTIIPSKQYVDDKILIASANATKDLREKDRAMDARVDELEAVTNVTEALAVVEEDITLTQTPIATSELVVIVNGISYFLHDGVFTISGKVITWDNVAAGFTLAEVLDTGDTVTVRYQYRNTARVTPIA